MMNIKDKIVHFFNALNFENINVVDDFYDQSIHFIDPIADIKGLEDVKNYYAGLYQHVTDISFEFTDIVVEGSHASAAWTMNLTLKKLNRGRPYSVPGISLIRFNDSGKAVYHRDYYDMGEFIYEKIGVVGSVIRYIKNKLKH